MKAAEADAAKEAALAKRAAEKAEVIRKKKEKMEEKLRAIAAQEKALEYELKAKQEKAKALAIKGGRDPRDIPGPSGAGPSTGRGQVSYRF